MDLIFVGAVVAFTGSVICATFGRRKRGSINDTGSVPALLTKATLYKNFLLFIVLLSIPPAADMYMVAAGGVPGTGIDLLLYWPIDFEYLAVAGGLFAILNAIQARKGGRSTLLGVGFGAGFSVIWFAVAFLATTGHHVALGGKL